MYDGDEAEVSEEHLHSAGSVGRFAAPRCIQSYYLQHQVSFSFIHS